jgi:CheY-like chemotaxis protein
MREIFLRSRWLRQAEGGDLTQGIAITRFPALVGRSADCDYQIPQPFISRRHCVFRLRDGDIWVEDLGSLNGTFLNDQRLMRPQLLHAGDQLDIAFLPYGVCLPLSTEGAVVQPAATSETATERGGPSQEVLVVDDNADAAQTLALLLEQWGHHVHVAHNGSEAVEAARAHRPDTVFLDIRLPGADGIEVAQQLRRQAGLDKAVMIGITGYDPVDILERSRQSDFQRLLTKPVSPETLQELLSQRA